MRIASQYILDPGLDPMALPFTGTIADCVERFGRMKTLACAGRRTTSRNR
jgi:hypothetical protein